MIDRTVVVAAAALERLGVLHEPGVDADAVRATGRHVLRGGGHPVGASGVRMLLDAGKQVSGTAGAYQVEGARTFATLNFGGSTATTVSLVVATTER